MPDKCKECGHDLKETPKGFKHVRTVRGSELMTVSCQVEGCDCLTPEPGED